MAIRCTTRRNRQANRNTIVSRGKVGNFICICKAGTGADSCFKRTAGRTLAVLLHASSGYSGYPFQRGTSQYHHCSTANKGAPPDHRLRWTDSSSPDAPNGLQIRQYRMTAVSAAAAATVSPGAHDGNLKGPKIGTGLSTLMSLPPVGAVFTIRARCDKLRVPGSGWPIA